MLYLDMFSAFSRLFHSFACFPSAKKNHPENGVDANSHNFSHTKTIWFKSEVFQNLPKHWEGRSRTAPIDRLWVFDPMSSRKTSGSKRKARMIWIMERKKLVNKKHQQKKTKNKSVIKIDITSPDFRSKLRLKISNLFSNYFGFLAQALRDRGPKKDRIPIRRSKGRKRRVWSLLGDFVEKITAGSTEGSICWLKVDRFVWCFFVFSASVRFDIFRKICFSESWFSGERFSRSEFFAPKKNSGPMTGKVFHS